MTQMRAIYYIMFALASIAGAFVSLANRTLSVEVEEATAEIRRLKAEARAGDAALNKRIAPGVWREMRPDLWLSIDINGVEIPVAAVDALPSDAPDGSTFALTNGRKKVYVKIAGAWLSE